MQRSRGNFADTRCDDLLWQVRGVIRAVAQLSLCVPAHRPETPIRLQKQTVPVAGCGGHHTAGNNPLRRIALSISPVAKLAVRIIAHYPETAVRLYQQAVVHPSGYRG